MTTIVVIEDNPQNARMADKLLKRAGYTVKLAEDGEMGLTTVFENEPDLILIDLGLPDIDGQTVIGLVRQQDTLKDVPIIAFTAWPQEEAHDMAQRYGCDGVITKPINTRTFADQIGDFLAEATQTSEDATPADASDETTEADNVATVATSTTSKKQPEDTANDDPIAVEASDDTTKADNVATVATSTTSKKQPEDTPAKEA
ncbi:MAG: response regulator [Chloroflexota bacterium]